MIELQQGRSADVRHASRSSGNPRSLLMRMMSPLSSITERESNGMEYGVIAHLDKQSICPRWQASRIEIVHIAVSDVVEHVVEIPLAPGLWRIPLAVWTDER